MISFDPVCSRRDDPVEWIKVDLFLRWSEGRRRVVWRGFGFGFTNNEYGFNTDPNYCDNACMQDMIVHAQQVAESILSSDLSCASFFGQAFSGSDAVGDFYNSSTNPSNQVDGVTDEDVNNATTLFAGGNGRQCSCGDAAAGLAVNARTGALLAE